MSSETRTDASDPAAAPVDGPPHLARLMDPDAPLARPERFVPGDLIAPAEPFVNLLVGGAFGLGLFGAALYAWARRFEAGVDDPAGLYVAPALAAVAWSRAAAGWLGLRRARAQRDRLDRGRWRRGLFVEDDGLLLVRAAPKAGPDVARWIPRAQIEGVDDSRAPARLQISGEAPIELPGGPQAIAHRLALWRAGKPFAWEERL